MIRRPARLLPLAAVMSMFLAPGPMAAGEPAGYEHFHTYAEVTAEIDAAVAAHPDIALRLSVGQSYEGRDIWAVKISDDVAVDDPNEPEVLFTGLTHARERLSNEMAMYIIELLTDGYAADQRIADIVNGREIWIIPMLNPDGAEFDIAGGAFHGWRKNRQPIPGTSAVGVDLNRQFGFMWACCGGSSANPAHEYYHGPEAWFAPEVRAYRDFVDSRVVDGRQQIRAIINWHTAGRLVYWPYAFTRVDVPRAMAYDDWRAFVALGRQLAALNGYTPRQSGDRGTAGGFSDDWAYHEHRVFAFTIEMAKGANRRYYPTAAEVAAELQNNTEAVLHFLEQTDCPYRAAGLGGTHCGPLYDDFETGRGWVVDPSNQDTATAGRWERKSPQKTRNAAGVKQRAYGYSGEDALVTGALRGSGVNANDLDGGVTSIQSPAFGLGTAGSTGWTLSFRYTFAHDRRASAADYLRVSANGAALFSQTGFGGNRNAVWTQVSVSLDAFAGDSIRLLIEAADGGPDSLVEAAIDDVRVYQAPTP